MSKLFGMDAFSSKIAEAEALTSPCLVLASLCDTFRALIRLA
jgi:hypothetical protein